VGVFSEHSVVTVFELRS